MNKDTAVGLVGAAVLVAALVGIFVYEANNAPPVGTGGDGATTSTASGPSIDGGVLAEGDTANEEIELNATGMSAVEFTLTWNDDVGAPDRFQLRVQPPGGAAALTSEEEDDGSIALRFDGLNADATGANGTGTWLVVVELVEAGDETTPVGGVPVTADDGNDWQVETRVTTYAAP